MTTSQTILRIATRGSTLALAQTRLVVRQIAAQFPDIRIETETIATVGDIDQTAPVAQLGDGAFVRGVERALLEGRADLAVHSAKDLPTGETPGLVLAAFPERGDARDALISRDGRRFEELPPGARMGTSSPRRAAIARSLRPDLDVLPVRGNVDTRLAKLRAGDYDALVLAAVGLARLGLERDATQTLDLRVWTPAAGQGALAVQCRAGAAAERLLARIDHAATRSAVFAERAVLRRLGSGCRTPMGAHAAVDRAGVLHLRAALIALDGSRDVRSERIGRPEEAECLGHAVAEELIQNGADIYRIEE